MLVVTPIIFCPMSDSAAERAHGYGLAAAHAILPTVEHLKLFNSHIQLAANWYQKILGSKFEFRPAKVYRAKQKSSYYLANPESDSAHTILRELLDWKKITRKTCKNIFIVVYTDDSKRDTFLGGGRTIKGPPNTGGGYIELEFSSLISDKPYPFQSTLVHELGHAFGLVHVDCYGYNMATNPSIMAYNYDLHTSGLEPSQGTLNPEEFWTLALNKQVFPNFNFNEKQHNPKGKQFKPIYLSPMDS